MRFVNISKGPTRGGEGEGRKRKGGRRVRAKAGAKDKCHVCVGAGRGERRMINAAEIAFGLPPTQHNNGGCAVSVCAIVCVCVSWKMHKALPVARTKHPLPPHTHNIKAGNPANPARQVKKGKEI